MALIPTNMVAGKAPNEEPSPALNSLVSPPILITRIRVFSMKIPNRNEYSTAPPTCTPLLRTDLTPLQKGHSYTITKHKDGSKVSCKHRVADDETAELLKNIPFKNPDEALVAKFQDAAHSIAILQYEWLIESTEMTLAFQNRVAALGGSFTSYLSDPVDLETLLAEGLSKATDIYDFHAEFNPVLLGLETSVSSCKQEKEPLREVLHTLQAVLSSIADITKSGSRLSTIVAELKIQESVVQGLRIRPDYQDFLLQASVCTDMGKEILNGTTKIGKMRAAIEESLKLCHLGKPKQSQNTLEHEVARLAEMFPAFSHMRVYGDTIQYKKGKFIIKFEPDGVYVEGDPLEALHKTKKTFVDDDMLGDL